MRIEELLKNIDILVVDVFDVILGKKTGFHGLLSAGNLEWDIFWINFFGRIVYRIDRRSVNGGGAFVAS